MPTRRRYGWRWMDGSIACRASSLQAGMAILMGERTGEDPSADRAYHGAIISADAVAMPSALSLSLAPVALAVQVVAACC
jgi:hypothetical protein